MNSATPTAKSDAGGDQHQEVHLDLELRVEVAEPRMRSRYTWPMPAVANDSVMPNMPPTCSQNAQ